MNKKNDVTENIFKILESGFQCKNTNYGVLVTIDTANGKEDVSLRSDKFRSILANRYRKEYGTIAPSSKMKDCILSHYGKIMEEYEKVKNSNRCDRGADGSIWIDRGDMDDTYFVISKNGLKIKKNASKYFYKHSRKGEIPLPDMKHGDIERIFKYCRVPEDMRNIFIAYLVSLFIGNIEHPCFVLNGSQGSGKTTVSTFIKALIDPVADNRPSAFPKKDADLELMYQDNYLVAFDNAQTLTARLSDKFCMITTGCTDSRRKLFTDNEMIHFDLCQPIIINGIHDIVKREDMLSRSIIVYLTKPTGKDGGAGEKNSLMEEFMNDRAVILGGLFQVLAKALEKYEPKPIRKIGDDIRMTSFYEYGYYICEAWKKGAGAEFCIDYAELLANQLRDFKKNPDLVGIVEFFLEENDYEWEGTMKSFSDELNEFAALVDVDDKIPPTPNRLSRDINNLRFEFEKAGITIETSRTPNNSCRIRLTLEKTD